ncbi:MAG: hypothetical protein LIP12_14540, partial [Clostridiales bacterium]|nr:hypothetical protein [Clostridiales bacterium]
FAVVYVRNNRDISDIFSYNFFSSLMIDYRKRLSPFSVPATGFLFFSISHLCKFITNLPEYKGDQKISFKKSFKSRIKVLFPAFCE